MNSIVNVPRPHKMVTSFDHATDYGLLFVPLLFSLDSAPGTESLYPFLSSSQSDVLLNHSGSITFWSCPVRFYPSSTSFIFCSFSLSCLLTPFPISPSCCVPFPHSASQLTCVFLSLFLSSMTYYQSRVAAFPARCFLAAYMDFNRRYSVSILSRL